MPRGKDTMNDLPPDAFGPPPGEKTYPCKNCGRKFVQATLKKHEAICKKMTQKKRKTFDAGKQRAGEGSDISYRDIQKVQKEAEKNHGVFKPPKTHWKEKHEQFVSAVRAAKHVDYALKTGTPLPPPPKSTVPSDYVKCDYCGRNFSQSAADRHIPFCKEQHARKNAAPGPNPRQKQAMQARTQNSLPGRRPAPKPSSGSRVGGSAKQNGGSSIPTPVTPRPFIACFRQLTRPTLGSSLRSNSAPKNPPGQRSTNGPSAPNPSKVPTANRGRSPARGVTNNMRNMKIK